MSANCTAAKLESGVTIAWALALEEYTNLEIPEWGRPFQALRVGLWAAMALPVIQMMKETTASSLSLSKERC